MISAFRILRSRKGSTAVEFALLAPALIAFIIGTLNAGMLMFSMSSLHYATEQGARCASVNASVCPTGGAAETHAANNYYAIGAPVFTHSSAACGASVSGSLDFEINVIFYRRTISLTSSSCFPT